MRSMKAYLLPLLFSGLAVPSLADTSISELEARLVDLEKKNLQLKILLLEKENHTLEEKMSKPAKAIPERHQHITTQPVTATRLSTNVVKSANDSSSKLIAVRQGKDRSKLDVKSLGSPWAGFYAGVTAGAIKSHVGRGFNYDYSGASYIASDYDATGPTVAHELSNKPVTGQSFSRIGALGGFHFGYNYQLKENVILGLETDISRLGVAKTVNVSASGSTPSYTWTSGGQGTFSNTNSSVLVGTSDASINWMATLRGRFGYTLPSWMLFATAGIALGNATASTTQLLTSVHASPCIGCNGINMLTDVWKNTNVGAQSATLLGLAASVGTEYSVTENLFLRAELLYFNLGGGLKFPISIANSTAIATMSVNFSGSALRGGVIYKF